MSEPVTRTRRWLPDLLGVAWVIVAAGAVMAPALSHGWSLGPFDQLSQLGLTQHLPTTPPQLAGLRPHPGDHPLDDTGVDPGAPAGSCPCGIPTAPWARPLAFNWQSATFSLPALLGYLVPVRLDYTVQVLDHPGHRRDRDVRAGQGHAARCARGGHGRHRVRAQRLVHRRCWAGRSPRSCRGPVGCSPAPSSSCGDGTADATSPCSLSSSPCRIYAGEPDTLVVLIVGARRLPRRHARPPHPPVRGSEAVGRPLLDVGIGSVAGLGLAAPADPPRPPAVVGVHPAGRTPQRLSPLRHAACHLPDVQRIVAGRKPILRRPRPRGGCRRPTTSGSSPSSWPRWRLVTIRRRPAVVAFGAVVVVTGCLVYLSPLVSFLNQSPGVAEVRWVRAIQVLGFGLAILAGAGLDALARSHGDRRVRNWLGAGFGAAAVLLLAGVALRPWPPPAGGGHHPIQELHLAGGRGGPSASPCSGSWPWRTDGATRRGRDRVAPAAGRPQPGGRRVPVGRSTVFLVALGASWWSSNTTYLAPTPAETALQKAVGTSIVGFGTSSCLLPPTLGIQANVNIVYGVHELDVYDPLTPQELYTAWTDASGHYPLPIGRRAVYRWPRSPCSARWSARRPRPACSASGSCSSPHGAKGPPGSVFDKEIGNEELYRIPGASVATISPLGATGSLPPVDAPGTPVAVPIPTPTSWKLVTHASTAPGPPPAAHRRPGLARHRSTASRCH